MTTDGTQLPNDLTLCHALIQQLHDTVHQSQRRIEKLEHQLTLTVVAPRLHHAIGVFLIVNWDLLCNSA